MKQKINFSKTKKTTGNKFSAFSIQEMNFQNKKAEMDELIKIVLWIIFFGMALISLYFLINKFIS